MHICIHYMYITVCILHIGKVLVDNPLSQKLLLLIQFLRAFWFRFLFKSVMYKGGEMIPKSKHLTQSG